MKLGNNITARISSKDENKLILTIDLSKKGKLSQTGRALIIANTDRFSSLEELGYEDVGVSLVVTRRFSKKSKKK